MTDRLFTSQVTRYTKIIDDDDDDEEHSLDKVMFTNALVWLLSWLILLSFPLRCRALSSPPQQKLDGISMTMASNNLLVTIAEPVWRAAAARHAARVKSILQPGLLSPQTLSAVRRKQGLVDDWTGLDPLHPIFNFLIEYYGIKGSKGTRRLARWSPDPTLLTMDQGQKMINTNGSESHSVLHQAAMHASKGHGGILLENAGIDDMGGTLHLRGAIAGW